VTWKNHYSPGVAEVSGVKVQRFRVAQQRNTKSFNAMSETIYSRLGIYEEQEAWMWSTLPELITM